MKTILCTVCGKEFEAQTRKAMYCPECKIIVIKDRAKLANKDRVQVLDDTDDMRMMCLHCTKPRCRGECEELAKIAKGTHG
jgi:DNA-directed RNA polymerase subunit RPC12/RpoP